MAHTSVLIMIHTIMSIVNIASQYGVIFKLHCIIYCLASPLMSETGCVITSDIIVIKPQTISIDPMILNII